MDKLPAFHALSPEAINHFLNRRKQTRPNDFDIHFDELFRAILMTANEFVPSEAGSILLDDPKVKGLGKPSENLVFIACFGEKASGIVGKKISCRSGIAGKTYLTGKSYRSGLQTGGTDYHDQFDQESGFKTRSIISVPIMIEKSVCGVLELINRQNQQGYTDREIELLKIFAGYISTSIQNALETKRSKELSKRDDLTSLYNDRYFHYALEQQLLQLGTDLQNLALVFLDLDNFKSVNDTHGHLAGSRTLTEVGMLLKRTIKTKNAVLARYGGDEFVMILPEIDLQESLALAEKVREAIGTHTFLKKRRGKGEPALSISGVITASIGVASFRDHCHKPGGPKEIQNHFIFLADQAMYAAKARGRNQVVCAEVD